MDKTKLKEIIDAQIADTDLFIVDINISPSLEIEVTLDSDTSVKIEQCIAVDRAVEASFDREIEDYSLTVASAGVGQPLRLARQFAKIEGREIDIVLTNGLKKHGLMCAHDELGVTITYTTKEAVEGKKRKVEVEKQEKYKFTDIKTVCEALFV